MSQVLMVRRQCSILLLKNDGTCQIIFGQGLVLFQSNSCKMSDGARLIAFFYSVIKQVCSLVPQNVTSSYSIAYMNNWILKYSSLRLLVQLLLPDPIFSFPYLTFLNSTHCVFPLNLMPVLFLFHRVFKKSSPNGKVWTTTFFSTLYMRWLIHQTVNQLVSEKRQRHKRRLPLFVFLPRHSWWFYKLLWSVCIFGLVGFLNVCMFVPTWSASFTLSW